MQSMRLPSRRLLDVREGRPLESEFSAPTGRTRLEQRRQEIAARDRRRGRTARARIAVAGAPLQRESPLAAAAARHGCSHSDRKQHTLAEVAADDGPSAVIRLDAECDVATVKAQGWSEVLAHVCPWCRATPPCGVTNVVDVRGLRLLVRSRAALQHVSSA